MKEKKEMFNHMWVITAHGNSPFLEECICSIKKQRLSTPVAISTATENEHILSLGKKYSIPVYVKAGKDELRENWNYAYNLANTEWVTLAHQDDIYEDTYTEELYHYTQSEKNALIFFCEYEPFGGASLGARRNRDIQCIIKWPLRIKSFSSISLFKKLTVSLGNAICCPSVSYNKEMLGKDIFLYGDDDKIKNNVDWELFIILTKKIGKFLYSPKRLCRYRIHDGQTTDEYMRSSVREIEDRYCFGQMWPKIVVDILMHFYKRAYDIY